MGEDSGYFSRRSSGEFSSFSGRGGIFDLSFGELQSSARFQHFRYGFRDERDFDEFKQDLRDFQRLGRRQQVLDSEGAASRDMLMDFFKSDEHFREFEREFDDLEHQGRRPAGGGDPFSDFFDNDEDFKEFEREFANFKTRRRSRGFDDFSSSRRSTCDLFADLRPSRDAEEEDGGRCARNSADNWDCLFNRFKRNSRVDLGSRRLEEFPRGSKRFGEIKRASTSFDDPYFRSTRGSRHLEDLRQLSSSFDDSYSEFARNRASRHPDDDETGSKTDTKGADLSGQSASLHRGVQHDCRRDCQYTCHHKCRQLVTLDCKNALPSDISPNGSSEETSLSEPTSGTASDSSPNDETDSGYRSGPITEENLPRMPSQDTLNREDLKRRIEEYNNKVPSSHMYIESDDETFQGFIKATLNLIRPITMSLGARPPSIYEVLTKEHIVEQNTQSVSFYMPRDTVKSIHVSSDETTKEVIAALLKKFRILDNPRKFAMYEQQLNNGKIVKLRRVGDKECPLQVCLRWGTEDLRRHRLVLQENETTGEIVWENFSLPELHNFMKVLNREEEEYVQQLQYKYRVMKRIIQQRLKEFKKAKQKEAAAGGQLQKVQ